MADKKKYFVKERLSLGNLKRNIYDVYGTLCRFPLPILFFLTLAIITIYRIEVPYEKIEDIAEILNRIMAVLFIGVPFSLSINLLFERYAKKINFFVKLGVYLLEILILFLYYYYLLPDMEMVAIARLLSVGIALILAFLFIPYLIKKANFEIYIIKIINRLVISVFFTVVIGLGFTAIVFAIKTLLYTNMNTAFYQYIWIIAGYIFAPIHFLHGLPKNENYYGLENYNKVIQVLLEYIVLPIISIYTVVLYIYFAKILITQVWPAGIVSYLVLSYAAVGILAIFLITPLKEKNRWVQVFVSLYNKITIPLLVMMFVSISIRIGDYGFTENRYYILIVGVWATLVIIFLNINKGKNNVILPISLAIVAILTVCGPWSAFNVSVHSQNQRLITILEKNDMIEDRLIVKGNDDIEVIDRQEITEILYYFADFHNLSEVQYLPENFNLSDMENIFGFTESVRYEDKSAYFNYRSSYEKPIDITGYNYIFNFKSYNYFDNGEAFYEELINTEYGDIELSINDNYYLELKIDEEVEYSYDLGEYIDSIIRNNTSSRSDILEEIILVEGNEKIKLMYIFESIGSAVNIDDLEYDNIEMQILVKVK